MEFYIKGIRYLSLLILLGFIPSYLIAFDRLSAAHHVHAIISFTWLLALNIQPSLLSGRPKVSHRTLGQLSILIALMLFVSFCILFAQTLTFALSSGLVYQLAYFLDLYLAPTFLALVSLAYLKRFDRTCHYRNIFLSLVVIFPPGLGRLIYGIFLMPLDIPMRYFYEPMVLITMALLGYVGHKEDWNHWPTTIVLISFIASVLAGYLAVYSGLLVKLVNT